MTETLTIFIADDHPVFRKGLRDLIAAAPPFVVIGEAADGETALRAVLELRPMIAVLDLDMPGKSGLDVAKEVRRSATATGVIILTLHKDEYFFNEAMDAGVLGYVLKESAIDDILESIRSVSAGRYYISPLISGYLVNRSSKQARLRADVPALDTLTQAERRILRHIADGKTTAEIAGLLFVSAKTVENHRTNISQKLGLHGTNSLLKFAIANRSFLE